jgi:hypothetical protein
MRRLLPDATFTDWSRIAPALRRAIAHPPTQPVIHDSVFAAYAGQPLAKRLGIRPGTRAALVGAVAGFRPALKPLPEGARLTSGLARDRDLVDWFVRRPADLQCGPERLRGDMGEVQL